VHAILVAQDVGGAIRGPVRGDIFFGFGPDAERRAGAM
jgi:membrane-bound lytic murein transglycosylase A